MTKNSFIKFMLEVGVLTIGEFVTKSGRLSPYFINTGNYSTGAELSTLGKAYARQIKEICGSNFDALFGPAYKGIPLVTAVATALYTEYGIDKPLFFNRKEIKDHGEGGNLIGYKPKQGDRVIIVEDVITAGTALRESMAILQSHNVKIKDMFISVDRSEKGQGNVTAVTEAKEAFGINIHSIVTVRDIYNYIAERPEYQEIAEKMRNYMNTYCIFG